MPEQRTLPALPVQDGVEFRHVPGFPGYCVGDDGSPWSCHKKGIATSFSDNWHPIKPMVRSKGGYLMIGLARNGRNVARFVHRLVLEAFVGPRPDKMQCRHLDGNPKNNRLRNLCWGTGLENAADTIRQGRQPRGSAHKDAKLREEDVEGMIAAARGGESLSSIAARYHVRPATVHSAVRGRSWKHVAAVPVPPTRKMPPRGARVCINGHEQTEQNVYRYKQGPRKGRIACCRLCRRERERG